MFGGTRLGAGSSLSLFRKTLSQQKRCWGKLVGLVSVGAESPVVEAVGALGASPTGDAGFGGNSADLVKPGLCENTAVTFVTGLGTPG